MCAITKNIPGVETMIWQRVRMARRKSLCTWTAEKATQGIRKNNRTGDTLQRIWKKEFLSTDRFPGPTNVVLLCQTLPCWSSVWTITSGLPSNCTSSNVHKSVLVPLLGMFSEVLTWDDPCTRPFIPHPEQGTEQAFRIIYVCIYTASINLLSLTTSITLHLSIYTKLFLTHLEFA